MAPLRELERRCSERAVLAMTLLGVQKPRRAQDVGSGPDNDRRSRGSPLNFGLRL